MVPTLFSSCRSLYGAALATASLVLGASPAQANSAEPYIGELMPFAGNFCPVGWLSAEGQPLRIADYEVLYTLLGTTYGGDGQQTFNLPDLRGRSPTGEDTGTGLGQQGGAEKATITAARMPAHTHTLPASTWGATHATPAAGRVPAAAQNGAAYAPGGSPNVALQGTQPSYSGPVPFDVRGPYTAVRWCIATTGIYPSQQ